MFCGIRVVNVLDKPDDASGHQGHNRYVGYQESLWLKDEGSGLPHNRLAVFCFLFPRSANGNVATVRIFTAG